MHQCVKCSTFYEDGSSTLLSGCEKCGGKFFFFINKKAIEKAKQITQDLTVEQKKEIEEDVLEILGERDDDLPVVLDLETINILEPGKYELDLVDMFKGKPLIYRLEEGKYIIDIASSFLAKNFDEKDFELKEKKDEEEKE
ncbi:MAG: Zn-ribbon containing protein [Nanoarchaeota archaeon]